MNLLSACLFGILLHLPGYYYPKDNVYFKFKPCYEDEVRYLVTIDDINLVKDYLDKEYDTELNMLKSGLQLLGLMASWEN
jgi:hypothetical protein